MKKISNSLFAQMSSKQIETLTTAVDETLVPGFYQPKAKIFTAADLWNIQRQGKSRIQRRLIA